MYSFIKTILKIVFTGKTYRKRGQKQYRHCEERSNPVPFFWIASFLAMTIR